MQTNTQGTAEQEQTNDLFDGWVDGWIRCLYGQQAAGA